jgi:hypothetical protein
MLAGEVPSPKKRQPADWSRLMILMREVASFGGMREAGGKVGLLFRNTLSNEIHRVTDDGVVLAGMDLLACIIMLKIIHESLKIRILFAKLVHRFPVQNIPGSGSEQDS